MKKTFYSAIIFLFALSLFGCSSISVSTDYDPTIDFSKYKTYAWTHVKIDDELSKNPLLKRRVQEAIDRVLQSKGFELDESGNADMLVYTFAGAKEKMNVTDWGYRYGGYWGGYPYGRNIDVNYYTEASLVIDVVDNEKDELIWRGVGTGIVREYAKPEERQEAINEAVTKILGDFPPGSSQE